MWRVALKVIAAQFILPKSLKNFQHASGKKIAEQMSLISKNKTLKKNVNQFL